MSSTRISIDRPFPVALRRVQYCGYVVAAIHLVATGAHPRPQRRHHRGRGRPASRRRRRPAGQRDDHAVGNPARRAGVLLPLRVRRLRSGRPASRIVLTIVLGIQLAAHATLPIVLAELPGYGAWVIAVQAISLVFEVAAMCLLWTAPARRYFAEETPRALMPTG